MLKRDEFLVLLDELVELPAATLKGPEALESLENWNSLAVVSFMAMADEHFGVTVGAGQIVACKTVNDLLALTGAPVG
jgi:acyl carrier protein